MGFGHGVQQWYRDTRDWLDDRVADSVVRLDRRGPVSAPRASQRVLQTGCAAASLPPAIVCKCSAAAILTACRTVLSARTRWPWLRTKKGSNGSQPPPPPSPSRGMLSLAEDACHALLICLLTGRACMNAGRTVLCAGREAIQVLDGAQGWHGHLPHSAALHASFIMQNSH